MEVIYGLIPSMIFIGIILIIILFWAIKTGQFDDFEGEAHRILMDDDLTANKDKHQKENKDNELKKESQQKKNPN